MLKLVNEKTGKEMLTIKDNGDVTFHDKVTVTEDQKNDDEKKE